ncbi:MAG TPA: 2-amino-4-hydroxy-6-hydroxymethyldihydropteridine diphosphokinase [Anaerolineae bacterium]|nr:2-amino-4-hydroxy-6-hydroxymethyldihydropteridine diphosphokinase [Anaerolineae bacterium]
MIIHRAYILLGSNVCPDINIPKALKLIGKSNHLALISQIWKTKAVGHKGLDFLNVAVLIETPLSVEELKTTVLITIEKTLGRVRIKDKYAPRTIDLDIIVFDDEILDIDIWKHDFIALPLAEILPNLKNPTTKETLKQTAERMRVLSHAEIYYLNSSH